jgi:hypothetical protein
MMSALVLYMLIVYLVHLRFGADRFTGISAITLGLSGVLASNPADLLLGLTTDFAGVVLMSCYVSLFRLFCLCQLAMIAQERTAPHIAVLVIFAGYFGFYTAIETTTNFRLPAFFQDFENILTNTEQLAWLLGSYSGIATIFVALALARSRAASQQKLYWFSFLLLADVGGNWGALWSSLRCSKFAWSVVPMVIRAAIPLTGGAFSLFLLHSTDEHEYQQIKEDASEEHEEELAVDEISANELWDDEGFPE